MEQYEYNPRKFLSRVGLSLFLMGISVLFSSFMIQLIVNSINPKLIDANWYGWAVTAITVVGIGLPVFYLSTKNIPDSEHRQVVKLRASEFIVLLFICIAAMYITNYIGLFINYVISLIKGEEIYNPLVDIVTNSNAILTFFYGAIVAPIVEELIFRKFLLSKVRRFGDLPAILITGFAFGLFHMNLSQFFYATALGCIFAYITIKTNTIIYSIFLHMIINAIGTTVAPLVVNNQNIVILMILGTWVITSITLGIVFFAINMKKIKFEKAEVPVEKKSVFFLNTGTILFALLCIIMMIISL
jgi:membrane protease YdiL (CAAX protease family)